MPKYDLRSWNQGHSYPCKGITLTPEELIALKNLLNEMDDKKILAGLDPVSEIINLKLCDGFKNEIPLESLFLNKKEFNLFDLENVIIRYGYDLLAQQEKFEELHKKGYLPEPVDVEYVSDITTVVFANEDGERIYLIIR